MPNDQFGRPIEVGDTVTLKGEVTSVWEDPNFINCTVKLTQQMPPAGTTTNLELNTAQLEKTGGSKSDTKSGAQHAQPAQQAAQRPQTPQQQTAQRPQTPPQPVQRPQPPAQQPPRAVPPQQQHPRVQPVQPPVKK